LYLKIHNRGVVLEQGGAAYTGHQAGVELLEALQQELAPAVPPVSTLPPDSALPTTGLAITATEAEGDKAGSQVGVLFFSFL